MPLLQQCYSSFTVQVRLLLFDLSRLGFVVTFLRTVHKEMFSKSAPLFGSHEKPGIREKFEHYWCAQLAHDIPILIEEHQNTIEVVSTIYV